MHESLYVMGINCCQTSDEKNPKTKEMVRGKVAEYLDRAEKLKSYNAKEENGHRKKPRALGANGKVEGGKGK